MAVVYDDGPPPKELRDAWLCKRWNCLPDAGGLHDQDWLYTQRMVVLENVHDALKRYRSAVGAQIHNLSDNERAILKWLMDLEVWHG